MEGQGVLRFLLLLLLLLLAFFGLFGLGNLWTLILFFAQHCQNQILQNFLSIPNIQKIFRKIQLLILRIKQIPIWDFLERILYFIIVREVVISKSIAARGLKFWLQVAL